MNDRWFKVRTLDDFKETESLRMNDTPGADKSSRTEMRICTLEDVCKYLKKEKRRLKKNVTEAAKDLKDAEDQLATYQNHTRDFLNLQQSNKVYTSKV